MDVPTLDTACHSDFSATRAAAIALFFATVSVFGCAFAVAYLPPDHRLQRLLAPLTRRLAATVGLGLVLSPLELIPGAAGPVDLIALAALCWFWWVFVAHHLLSHTSPLRQRPKASTADGTSYPPPSSDIEPNC